MIEINDELRVTEAKLRRNLITLQQRKAVRFGLWVTHKFRVPLSFFLNLSRTINKLKAVLPFFKYKWAQLRHIKIRSLGIFYKKIDGPNKKSSFNIIGLMRQRNESQLLKDSLDNFADIVDGIIVYDDASTDSSVSIASRHPAVIEVVVSKKWQKKNRPWEEAANRNVLVKAAKKYSPQWIFYADADERFEGKIRQFLLNSCPPEVDGIRISLFDSYITPGDSGPYQEGMSLFDFRKFFGIEKRDILMIWRNEDKFRFDKLNAREPSGLSESRVITKFYCQHYGKSLSIEHWDETCRYYIDNIPQYADKWKRRLGKAIHTKSDFGTKLYTWDEVKKRGVRIN